ncbi:SRPBCC family protein [Acidobacteriota bacterium]
MKRKSRIRTAITCLMLAILSAAALWFLYRPWALTWGSTDEEIVRVMPGDEVLERPTFNATRAVTIEATPEEIWPWIVQIGYRRAGFYSYDQLDNEGIPSAERILPEYQNLKVNDLIPLSKSANVRVTALDPPKSMVLLFEVEGTWSNATWVWGLFPEDASHTRLVTRLRADPEGVRARVFLDLGEIIMMRKCMLGIKRRAESGQTTEVKPS